MKTLAMKTLVGCACVVLVLCCVGSGWAGSLASLKPKPYQGVLIKDSRTPGVRHFALSPMKKPLRMCTKGERAWHSESANKVERFLVCLPKKRFKKPYKATVIVITGLFPQKNKRTQILVGLNYRWGGRGKVSVVEGNVSKKGVVRSIRITGKVLVRLPQGISGINWAGRTKKDINRVVRLSGELALRR